MLCCKEELKVELSRYLVLEKFKSILLLSIYPRRNNIMPKNYAREVALCSTDFGIYDASIPPDKKYLHKSETRYVIAQTSNCTSN